MSAPLKIVFAGTPDFAAEHLQALLDSEHQVIAVYSQPDRPAGRGKKLQSSPVKQLAMKHNLPVFQPDSLKDPASQQQLMQLNADVMVVVAYGLILPQAVLDMPRLGCLNVHGSLLPKWRGAAPIQRSIWAGDSQTGVTIMQMDKGLDTGAMLLKREVEIQPTDTSATLYAKLAELGPQALVSCLNTLETIEPTTQNDSLASYAHKLSKEEALLDWNLGAHQLERNVRAFNPWPVSFFNLTVDNAKVAIKVWKAEVETTGPSTVEIKPGQIVRADKHGLLVQTVDDALLIRSIQIPGKKALEFADVFNSRKDWFAVGQIL